MRPGIAGGLDDVRVLVLAVVVQWMQIVYHCGIAKERRENVAPDQVRRDFLEEIFLILIDFVGLAAGRSGALICRIRQRTRCRRVEYFLVQFLQVVKVQIWYLLHNVHDNGGVCRPHDLVHLNAERN